MKDLDEFRDDVVEGVCARLRKKLDYKVENDKLRLGSYGSYEQCLDDIRNLCSGGIISNAESEAIINKFRVIFRSAIAR